MLYIKLTSANLVLILSRNIYNTDELSKFIKTLQSKTTKPNLRVWLKSTFRKYLLNDFDKITKITKVKSTDPDWVKTAINNKEKLLKLNLKNTKLLTNIENIIDWINTDSTITDKKKLNFTFSDAIKHSNNFRKKLANSKINDDSSDIKIIKSYKNGFKIVELIGKPSLIKEGKLMRHCVGDECQDYYPQVKSGKIKIFSLRDKNNKPHATLEYDVKTKNINQIKGKANSGIKQTYVKYIKDFLKKPPKSIKINKIDDLKNIGIIIIANLWYNMYNLPNGLKVNGELNLSYTTITKLPSNLTVKGNLYINDTKISELPSGLRVIDEFHVSDTNITKLPSDLYVGGDLDLSNTNIKELPSDLTVRGNFYINDNNIRELPSDLHVDGDLDLSYTGIYKLPSDLYVGGNLDLGHTNITKLPSDLTVRGNFYINRNNIRELPSNLHVDGELDLSYTGIYKLPSDLNVGKHLILSNSAIKELPSGLKIKGNLDLSETDIKELPSGLKIKGNLDLRETDIKELPSDLDVSGKIYKDF